MRIGTEPVTAEIVELPQGDGTYELGVRTTFNGGVTMTVELTQEMITQIILKGDSYFISMDEDGVATIHGEHMEGSLPRMTSLAGMPYEEETLDGLLYNYIDIACDMDHPENGEPLEPPRHLLKMQATLEKYLEQIRVQLADRGGPSPASRERSKQPGATD